MPETVHILRETRITLPTAPGFTQEMVALTYTAAGLAPRIVYVDPTHDSEDERKRAIAADLKAAREAKPQTLELP